MSAIGPIASSSSGAAKAAQRRARASQKPKPASGLNTSLPEQMDSGSDAAHEARDEALDHSGTAEDVPFRNAAPDTYFTPAFITQLLGQLLPDPERKASGAFSAYREFYARIRICDRLL
jgi:hypothetical protein